MWSKPLPKGDIILEKLTGYYTKRFRKPALADIDELEETEAVTDGFDAVLNSI